MGQVQAVLKNPDNASGPLNELTDPQRRSSRHRSLGYTPFRIHKWIPGVSQGRAWGILGSESSK